MFITSWVFCLNFWTQIQSSATMERFLFLSLGERILCCWSLAADCPSFPLTFSGDFYSGHTFKGDKKNLRHSFGKYQWLCLDGAPVLGTVEAVVPAASPALLGPEEFHFFPIVHFSFVFSFSIMVYYRVWSAVPCVMQQDPVKYFHGMPSLSKLSQLGVILHMFNFLRKSFNEQRMLIPRDKFLSQIRWE